MVGKCQQFFLNFPNPQSLAAAFPLRNGLTGQSPVEQLTSGHISPFNDGQGKASIYRGGKCWVQWGGWSFFFVLGCFYLSLLTLFLGQLGLMTLFFLLPKLSFVSMVFEVMLQFVVVTVSCVLLLDPCYEIWELHEVKIQLAWLQFWPEHLFGTWVWYMFTLSLPYNLPNTQFVCVCICFSCEGQGKWCCTMCLVPQIRYAKE